MSPAQLLKQSQMTETIEEDTSGMETPPVTQTPAPRNNERLGSLSQRSPWETRMRSSIPLPLDPETLSNLLGTSNVSTPSKTDAPSSTPNSTKSVKLARKSSISFPKPAFVPLRRPRKSLSVAPTTPVKVPSASSAPSVETPTSEKEVVEEVSITLPPADADVLQPEDAAPSPLPKKALFPTPVTTPSVRLTPSARRSSFVKTPTFQNLKRPSRKSGPAEPTSTISNAKETEPEVTTASALSSAKDDSAPVETEDDLDKPANASETTHDKASADRDQDVSKSSNSDEQTDAPDAEPPEAPASADVPEPEVEDDTVMTEDFEDALPPPEDDAEATKEQSAILDTVEEAVTQDKANDAEAENNDEEEDDEVVAEDSVTVDSNTSPAKESATSARRSLRSSVRAAVAKPPTRDGKSRRGRPRKVDNAPPPPPPEPAVPALEDHEPPVKRKRGRPPKSKQPAPVPVDSDEDDEVVLANSPTVLSEAESDADGEPDIKKEIEDNALPAPISFRPMARYGGRSTRAQREERVQKEKQLLLANKPAGRRRGRRRAAETTLIGDDNESDAVVPIDDNEDSEEEYVDDVERTIREEEEQQVRRSSRLNRAAITRAKRAKQDAKKTKEKDSSTSAKGKRGPRKSSEKGKTVTRAVRAKAPRPAKSARLQVAKPAAKRKPKPVVPPPEPEYWSDGEVKKEPTKRILKSVGSLTIERYRQRPTLDNPLRLSAPESLPRDEDGKIVIGPEDLPKMGRGYRPYELKDAEVVIVNPEKFTMADLCADLSIGMTDEKFAKYEEERTKRRKRREEIYKAKKRARLEGKSIAQISQIGSADQEEEIKEIEEGQKKFNDEISKSGTGVVSAPQMQIVGGEIQVNTESIYVDRHRQAAEELGDSRVVEVETSYSKVVNNASYSKHKFSERWDHAETERFYSALSQWGSDFSMLAQLFPGRSRRDLRNKFKLEERKNRVKLDLAMERRLPVSVDEYSNISGTQIVSKKEVDDMIQEIDEEFQQRMKTETENRDRARAADAENAMREDANNFGGLSTQGFSNGQRKTKSQIRRELQRNEIVLGSIDD